jgi:hypothetical protein
MTLNFGGFNRKSNGNILSVKNLVKGLYILAVSNDNKEHSYKIIIK